MNKNNEMFLHELWARSADRRAHMNAVRRAEENGLPRPRIPAGVRKKYTVTRAQLSESVPETYNKLEPKEDKNGNVVLDEHGDIVWKRVKPRISHRGVDQSIKDMHTVNC